MLRSRRRPEPLKAAPAGTSDPAPALPKKEKTEKLLQVLYKKMRLLRRKEKNYKCHFYTQPEPGARVTESRPAPQQSDTMFSRYINSMYCVLYM